MKKLFQFLKVSTAIVAVTLLFSSCVVVAPHPPKQHPVFKTHPKYGKNPHRSAEYKQPKYKKNNKHKNKHNNKHNKKYRD